MAALAHHGSTWLNGQHADDDAGPAGWFPEPFKDHRIDLDLHTLLRPLPTHFWGFSTADSADVQEILGRARLG